MRVKILLTAFFMFIAVSGAMAFEWKSAGMEIRETGIVEGENYIILKDGSANEIKVRFQGELGDQWAEAVVSLNSKFRGWTYMKAGTLEFFLNGNTLEVLIIPSGFSYKGINFMPNIPGGMTFLYDYDLRYNFRVNKGDFFLRLNDKFIDEVSLCERMKEAVEDPISYMKKREPEYFLRKLNELEEAQKEAEINYSRIANALLYYQNTTFLGFGNTPVKSQVIKRVIELKASDPKLKKDKIKAQLASEKIEATDKEIGLILSVFYNEFQ